MPQVDKIETFVNYDSYEIVFDDEPGPDTMVWQVSSVHTDSVVSDLVRGDLIIRCVRYNWDNVPIAVEGRRRATSLERAWLSTLIEVHNYVRRGVTVLDGTN